MRHLVEGAIDDATTSRPSDASDALADVHQVGVGQPFEHHGERFALVRRHPRVRRHGHLHPTSLPHPLPTPVCGALRATRSTETATQTGEIGLLRPPVVGAKLVRCKHGDEHRDRPGRTAAQVPRGARQAAATGRQPAVHRGHRCLRALRRGPLRRSRRARAAVRRGHVRVHRWRIRRSDHRREAARGRRRRRPHHREGRRLRRHVVLEPLSRRPVRHRGVRLPAAARGDRAHAEREVHARPRDPRPLTPHRTPLRPVRPRRVLHRGHLARLGRRRETLDHPHQPGRRDASEVRGDGNRPAAPPEAAGHPRHRDLRRPQLPHQPMGLRLHRRRSRPARR